MRSKMDLEPEYSVDALEHHRQKDIHAVENFLKSHEVLGEFFVDYWNEFNHFIRVEEYHQDVRIVKHEEISRKVLILLEGNVSAFILTNESPKPIIIYDFVPGNVISDVNALLGDRHHCGLIARTDCKLITFDMEYIEHEVDNPKIYSDFIDILYPVSGKLTAEVCNISLKQKLDLRDLFRKHNFFADVDSLDEHELNRMADSMQYIFLPSNEVLLDEMHHDTIYLVESGTVSQTKIFDTLAESQSYIYTRSLKSVYINNSEHDLQEVFSTQMEVEDQINHLSEFDRALSESEEKYKYKMVPQEGNRQSDNNLYKHIGSDIKSNFAAGYNNQDAVITNTINITEDIHRYGVVGEDYLSNLNNVKINAITKTPCCLIEIRIEDVLPKHSVAEQITGFFNNKINDMQSKVINKQQEEVEVKNKYITLVNFSFMFMVIMAILGISGKFHGYLNLSSQGALVHHITLITLSCALLIKFLKPLKLTMSDFGLTASNFSSDMMQVVLGGTVVIALVTLFKALFIELHGHKLGYELFQPDLVINDNITAIGFGIFLLLYIAYIFIYELCARGILQNIFSIILTSNYRTRYWGSIFASSAIASQFHMSLFHEFSLLLFMGNLYSGVIFANTRNLWAAFIFHSLFSLYILTVLGLLPGSHY